MSIISAYETDRSGVLAKRYAALAVGFFDRPDEAQSSAARIPLENLFRILEMYRHGAFSDDDRKGVLTMVSQTENFTVGPTEKTWHTEIEGALTVAMQDAFAGASKEDAVRSLQGSLRWLVSHNRADNASVGSAKRFFATFSQALA